MNRTLHLAIALSLALHGVLLFGLAVERKASLREPPLPRLEARLVEPEPPAPAPPAPPAPRVEPKKVEKKVAKAVRPKPAPRVAETTPPPKLEPRPAPAPLAEPEPEIIEAPPAAPAPPAVAKVEPKLEAKPAPVPAGPSAEEIEALTREQYRLALINAARRHNRYPPLARENHWEGEVLVRMVIGVDGAVSLNVQRSSSHEVLDRQALDMFRRAQSQVPLPAALRGKPLSFELRAIYSLKDQGSG